MVLVLIISDLSIPQRAVDLPPKFKKLLVPGKIQHLILTGNVGSSETLAFLRSVCPDIHAVRGDLDEFLEIPTRKNVEDTDVLSLGSFRIGVVHGHQIVPKGDPQALSIVARRLDVDVLITGYTHKFEAFEYFGRFFVNPGSATGAPLPDAFGKDITPSFVLMDVQNTLIVMYVYHLINGDVRVEKLEFSKKLFDQDQPQE